MGDKLRRGKDFCCSSDGAVVLLLVLVMVTDILMGFGELGRLTFSLDLIVRESEFLHTA